MGKGSITRSEDMPNPETVVTFRFWLSPDHGLVRLVETATKMWHPEVWREGHWETGSTYVWDAITGMGEDPWSCGEHASSLTLAEAEKYAVAHGVDLCAENADPVDSVG